VAIVELYPSNKTAHRGLALASGSLFVSRGVAMLVGWTLGMRAPVRYLSYVIDTSLLGTALLLLAIPCLNLFATPWLAAKLALFVAYIVFGSLALKRARIRAPQYSGFRCGIVLLRDDVQHCTPARAARLPATSGNGKRSLCSLTYRRLRKSRLT